MHPILNTKDLFDIMIDQEKSALSLVKIVKEDRLENLKNKFTHESLSYWDKAKEICKQYPSYDDE